MTETRADIMPRPAILNDTERRRAAARSIVWRRAKNRAFFWFCVGVASLSVLVLVVLLTAVTWQGVAGLNGEFLTSRPSPDPAMAGIYPALLGTVWVCLVCGVVALPLGVATAVFLEEFKPQPLWMRRVHGFIQLNIANLAGVPSVVYGIVGLTAFVWMFSLFGSPGSPAMEWGVSYYDQHFNSAGNVVLVPVTGSEAESPPLREGMRVRVNGRWTELNLIGPDAPFPEEEALAARTIRRGSDPGRISDKSWYYVRIPFGRGVLAGGLTLMLVILPIVILASQEALRAVPDSLRDGALGMGATRWQVVKRVTLPAAVPGIMTGSILAMSRAIGEAAPLLMIAGIVFIATPPGHLMDDFTAMPLQIYNWAQRPQKPFHDVAASGIIVLLVLLLAFNALAVYIRHRFQKPLS